MSHGYIYIPNWNHFQHYKDRRPSWIKLHVDLLGNDAWLELRPSDRCLLITIWMLVGMYGNGRCKADPMWLYRQANVGQSNAYQGLKRLNDAGFIQILASPVAREHARAEVEGSKEPKETDSAASSARRNGAAAAHKKELEIAIRTASSWLPDDPRHLVEHTIHQTWPELADEVIAGLPQEPAA